MAVIASSNEVLQEALAEEVQAGIERLIDVPAPAGCS
jgi:hypothetical protein